MIFPLRLLYAVDQGDTGDVDPDDAARKLAAEMTTLSLSSPPRSPARTR